MRRSKSWLQLLTVLLVASAPLLLPKTSGFMGAAWADDDDDDGGDDSGGDDDDDDDGGQRRAPVAAPAPSPPPPPRAANEILALALSEADLATLLVQGFQVLEKRTVPGLGITPRRLRAPPGTSLDEARTIVRALSSGGDADFNHFYRTEQGFAADCAGGECPARRLIDWPQATSRDEACGAGVRIGMVDTGINEDHETFRGSRLVTRRLAGEGLEPSGALHGTAVAALFVGDPATRAPGLVPGAQLTAVDAFHRQGADERADAFSLVAALGLLIEDDARVVNLSLAGPPNTALEEVVSRLVGELDVFIVAAAGNGGPRAEPFYPAAYDGVFAVTAVDREGTVYRRAGQGPHIDLAAPGVDVWTAASVRGARPRTGTSFAAPFVSAAAAMLREARPELTAAEVTTVLREQAKDLGAPGFDPVFGAGLLSLGDLCDEET